MGHPDAAEADIGHDLSDILTKVLLITTCSAMLTVGPPGPESKNGYPVQTAMQKEDVTIKKHELELSQTRKCTR